MATCDDVRKRRCVMRSGYTEGPIQGARVLVVDDEPTNLNLLETVLSRVGYQIALFMRGQDALAAAGEFAPDVILLDIRMPGLDGYEVCRRLKTDVKTRGVPIIFMSGLTSGDDIAAGFSAGGVDFVTKPVRQLELLARLNMHIRLFRAYHSLAEQHQALRELEEYRDTLVHMVVHDMRSPLQSILGHLQLIEQSAGDRLGKDDRLCLSQAIGATRRLSRLTSEIIDVNRLETRCMSVHARPLALLPLVNRLVTSEIVCTRGHQIALAVGVDCPLLEADPLLLERILMNLLDNAIKYSPDGTTVTVGAAPDPHGVRVWVQNQGVGVPEEHQQRIFQKFTTLHQDDGLREKSSGLGLAFCKLAVEAQGGKIGVENPPEGGCRFWFVVPSVDVS